MFYKFNNYQLLGRNLYRCVVLALTITPCISQAHTGLADVDVVKNYDNALGNSESGSQGMVVAQHSGSGKANLP